MRNFQVYRTSAGAGKTYTIVKEFIKLSLKSKFSASNIAAITFTNKAANEMKNRVIEYLVGITEPSPISKMQALCNELAHETNLSSDEVKSRCKKTLDFLLHNYSQFAVSTIDSFVHDILRVFSRDLKLPENFTVELDTDILKDNIVNTIYAGIKENETDKNLQAINNYLIDLTLEHFKEKEKWDLSFLLSNTANLLFREDSLEGIKSLAELDITDFAKFNYSLNKTLTDYQTKVRNIAIEATNSIVIDGLDITDFYQGKNGIATFFKNLCNFIYLSDITYNSYVDSTINQGTWVAKGKQDKIPLELKDKLIRHFNEIINLPENEYKSILVSLKNSLPFLALISYMQKIFSSYKIEKDIVHISEFNKTVSEVVKNESAPFIYERIGQIYQHYLLDEFQDTSIMQWHNMFPLIDNTLANSNKILVVGDVKQSIYRFRNSEMQLLMELPKIYPPIQNNEQIQAIENQIKSSFYNFSDDVSFKNINYRSDEQIVNFNNKHFEWLSSFFSNEDIFNPLIVDAYKNSRQNVLSSAKDKGFVKVTMLNEQDNDNNQINEIIEICEQHRPNFKDIAILVRSNKNITKIASSLMQNKNPIPVICNESLLLSYSDKVNFVIDLISIIENNNNKVAIVSAYTFLLNHLKLPSLNNQNYTDWLLSCEPKDLFTNFVILLRENKYDFFEFDVSKLNIYELTTSIIQTFNLDQDLDNYILFFQNAVLDYFRKNNASLYDFLNWWNKSGSQKSIILPEGANAVRILSVHQSKGLQFPIVIYPYADFSISERFKDIWIDTEILPEQVRTIHNFPKNLRKVKLEISLLNKINPESKLFEILCQEKYKSQIDSINIHYVAMTRAVNKLYVISKKTKESNSSSLNISNIIKRYLEFLVLNSEVEPLITESSEIYSFGNENADCQLKSNVTSSNEVLDSYAIRKFQTSKMLTREVTNKNELPNSVEFGKLFHSFISQFDFNLEPNKQIVEFCNGLSIDSSVSERLIELTNMLVNHELYKVIFKNTSISLNESTIISGTNTYRPDKIMFDGEKVIVVDFKTGIKKSEHKDQIRNYYLLLEDMGYKQIECYIVYISSNLVEFEQMKN